MKLLSLVLLLLVCTAELALSSLRLRRPERIVRVLLCPCLILCCFTAAPGRVELWMLAALIFEAARNALSSFHRSYTVLTLVAGLLAAAAAAAGFYFCRVWDIAAPHYTYTVFLIHICAITILCIRIYPMLTNRQLILRGIGLVYLGAFSSCAIVAAIYDFSTATVFIALGAFLAFFHCIFELYLSVTRKNIKLGAFEAMIIYIFSRVLLVFGSQLAL